MSAVEVQGLERQLEQLSFSEQLSVMEYLARLMRRTKAGQEEGAHGRAKKRRFGSAKQAFVCPQDFDEDNEEIARLFGAV